MTKQQNILLAILLVLPFSMIISSCGSQEKKIVIISTNDIHAGIENFPNLATLVQQYRNSDAQHTLLIDAGDRWTGNPYVDMVDEKGYPIINLMNMLKYDLGTNGNHEFDFGIEVLQKRLDDMNFEIICANYDVSKSGLSQPKAYKIVDVDGVKIGFIGAITTARGGYPDGMVKNFKTIKFYNPIESVAKYKHLKDSCDVLIGLTHLGYESDSILAMVMPELDLIIGGHSHNTIPNGVKINKPIVTQAGSSLNYAGITTITMRSGKIQSIENTLVKLDTIPADAKYKAIVDQYKNADRFKQIVGRTSQKFNKNNIMNMVSDAVRVGTKVDIAFYNGGGIRVDSLGKNIDITLAVLYSMEPFGNMIDVVTMTPCDIKDLILTKFNSRGKESQYIDLHPSGITYQILTDKNGQGLDVLLSRNGKPLEGKKYTVALSDYVHGQYSFSRAGTGIHTGQFASGILMNYIKTNTPLVGSDDNRATIKIESL